MTINTNERFTMYVDGDNTTIYFASIKESIFVNYPNYVLCESIDITKVMVSMI